MKNIKNNILVDCSLLLVFCVSFISAQTIQISGGNTGEYWLFIDSLKEHIEDKLKLSLSYNEFVLSGQFFFWQPSLPNLKRLQYIDYAIEYKNEPIDITYGRYYATFGQGLVLNQFLDEDFKTDNSIYGAKIIFNILNSDLSVLFGKPRNIFFEENQYKITNDTTDQLRAIEFNTNLIPKTKLGGRYLRFNRRVDLTPKSFTEIFGVNLGFASGPYDAYLEYARQLGCYPVLGGRLTGNGLILSQSLTFSGLGLSLQIFNYDTIGYGGTNYRYNEPPTPIKSGISVNRGTDEIGYALGINYSPFANLNIEVGQNKITTHYLPYNRIKQLIYINNNLAGILEQIIKVKANPNEKLELISGVERVVKQQIELPINKKIETKPYLEATYNLGEYFIEGSYEHNFITTDTSRYYDQAISVSVGKSELFQLTLRYERRNRIPVWLLNKLGSEKSWPMAELSLDITNKHNLRVRIGGEKGGLVCSGGVCRYEEPFKGIKVVLTSIF
ncbi:MAG: DUF6029 family protein [candidate division WOR-3 bacterium]